MATIDKIRAIKEQPSFALDVDDIKVVYHKLTRVLTGVSLRVKEGGIVALLGSNGAGKTTVIRTIGQQLGLYSGKVTEGRIYYRGTDIYHAKLQAHHLAQRGLVHVPEGRHIFKHMSVEENIRIGTFARRGTAFSLAAEMAKVYLYFPSLRPLQNKPAGYLSGGEQQMLAIARGLVAAPHLLMLDEPSLGLAPIVAKQMFDTIRAINHDLGTTILLVEQNAKAALDLAGYGYILDLGQVVLSGPASELKDNPDVKDLYLGLGASGQRKSFSEIKSYRRRRRWL